MLKKSISDQKLLPQSFGSSITSRILRSSMTSSEKLSLLKESCDCLKHSLFSLLCGKDSLTYLLDSGVYISLFAQKNGECSVELISSKSCSSKLLIDKRLPVQGEQESSLSYYSRLLCSLDELIDALAAATRLDKVVI